MDLVSNGFGGIRRRLAGQQADQERIRKTLGDICERWFTLALDDVLAGLTYKQKILTLKFRNKVFTQEFSLRQNELLVELKQAGCVVEKLRFY